MRKPSKIGVALAALVVTATVAAVAWLYEPLGMMAPTWWPWVDPGAATRPSNSPAPATRPPPRELLPDLRVLPPSELTLIGSRAEGNLRLKFTTVVWNDGDGPVEVRGAYDEATGALHVAQYLHLENGEVVPGPTVGTFDFEHRHGHLHLNGFARYELWSLDDDGEPLALEAVNPKVGFCLMDNLPIDGDRPPEEPTYFECEADIQGISVGYGDLYAAELFEQDLNVSHLPDGRYRLVNVANPEGVIRERDTRNNARAVDFVLSGRTVSTEGPR
ncbi:MAG: lysyl oxidase family protein [Trueperaceae bacterium]